LALPTDANGLGNVLGGKVMHLVDLAAAMAGMRHARRPIVTASVDSFHFLHPVHIGDLVLLHSSVNRVFRTSMEVGVKVMTENLMTGLLFRLSHFRGARFRRQSHSGSARNPGDGGRNPAFPGSRGAPRISACHA
jgi:acyl-coenzyme A thioesterase PaaI-like protein